MSSNIGANIRVINVWESIRCQNVVIDIIFRVRLRLLVLLVVSGISSVVERTLLASTQQRMSPANATLFGFSNFAIDGGKLFGKLSNAFSSSSHAVIGVGLLFVGSVLTDFQVGVTSVSEVFLSQVGGCVVVAWFELMSLLIFSSSQSQYVSIAFSRLGTMFAISEIVFTVMLLLVFVFHVASKITSSVGNSFSTALPVSGLSVCILSLILFPVLLFTLEKVPFDLVEAESELIDGVTTEFDGFVFSVVYAAEVALGFVLLKLLTSMAGFVILGLATIFGVVFTGRVFLTRFLFVDAVEVLLTVGLFLTTVLTVVFEYYVRVLGNSRYRLRTTKTFT